MPGRILDGRTGSRDLVAEPVRVERVKRTVAVTVRLDLMPGGDEVGHDAREGLGDEALDEERALHAVASLLAEATPTELAGDTLTVEFPSGNDFHRQQIAEPQNIGLLRDALYEVTGRRLSVVLEAGEAAGDEQHEDEPVSEESWISSLKETFDAREVTDE